MDTRVTITTAAAARISALSVRLVPGSEVTGLLVGLVRRTTLNKASDTDQNASVTSCEVEIRGYVEIREEDLIFDPDEQAVNEDSVLELVNARTPRDWHAKLSVVGLLKVNTSPQEEVEDGGEVQGDGDGLDYEELRTVSDLQDIDKVPKVLMHVFTTTSSPDKIIRTETRCYLVTDNRKFATKLQRITNLDDLPGGNYIQPTPVPLPAGIIGAGLEPGEAVVESLMSTYSKQFDKLVKKLYKAELQRRKRDDDEEREDDRTAGQEP